MGALMREDRRMLFLIEAYNRGMPMARAYRMFLRPGATESDLEGRAQGQEEYTRSARHTAYKDGKVGRQ